MVLVELTNVSKGFGKCILYRNVNLRIKVNDKAVLVGPNGSGKTTLINMIVGSCDPDAGGITRKAGLVISSLEQELNVRYMDMSVQDIVNEPFSELNALQKDIQDIADKLAVFSDEVLLKDYGLLYEKFEKLNGYNRINEKEKFVSVFGIDRFRHKKYRELSGGEKQYIRLALALFAESDLIILDEPLSFLDRTKIRWLMDFIENSAGTYLLVSHDEQFISPIANKIFDIDNNTINAWFLDYDGFVKGKEKRGVKITQHNKTNDNIIKEKHISIEKRKKWMKTALEKHRHAVIIRSMERDIVKLEKSKVTVIKDDDYDYGITLEAETSKRYIELCTLTSISMSYGANVIFDDLNMTISNHDRIVILGPNGSGKTTLLNIISKVIVPEKGTVSHSSSVKIGYVPQEFEAERSGIMVFDYLARYADSSDADYLSSVLDKLYTGGDYKRRRLNTLSGGEKKRLQILSRIMNRANLLLIDEITTYMDANSRKKISGLLNGFNGAIVIVSHDDDPLDGGTRKKYRIVDRRLALEDVS
jgi:ATPase subunit of ABC transporter with duplicated ATPase domains